MGARTWLGTLGENSMEKRTKLQFWTRTSLIQSVSPLFCDLLPLYFPYPGHSQQKGESAGWAHLSVCVRMRIPLSSVCREDWEMREQVCGCLSLTELACSLSCDAWDCCWFSKGVRSLWKLEKKATVFALPLERAKSTAEARHGGGTRIQFRSSSRTASGNGEFEVYVRCTRPIATTNHHCGFRPLASFSENSIIDTSPTLYHLPFIEFKGNTLPNPSENYTKCHEIVCHHSGCTFCNF